MRARTPQCTARRVLATNRASTMHATPSPFTGWSLGTAKAPMSRPACHCRFDGPREAPIFLNVHGRPITRYGIHGLVVRIAKKAAETVPSLRDKRVSPHTVRHATAVHLLRAGVDINTIRAWLGHVSLETTNRYAEVDLEMKAKALQMCADDGMDSMHDGTPSWHSNSELMAFLASL